MNRNGNFCKGTCFSKVIAEAKVEQQKKFTGFSCMSVMANLLCFGGAFSSHRFIFLLACIDR